MTQEEWKEVESRLTFLKYPVKLKCDKFEIALVLERIDQFTNGIMVYVNGVFEGRWVTNDCEERRRFLRPVTKSIFSAKHKKSLKKLPKRLRKEMGLPDPETKHTYYHFYWTSFRALKSHLIKNNCDIELVKE